MTLRPRMSAAATLGLLFAPFRGLRYAEPGSLARRIAPPYDVIGSELRKELARRDHANIVHADLPQAPLGGDPYGEAAQLLEAWQQSGILTREDEPCAYLLRTTTTREDGSRRSRTGVFLGLTALPFSEGGRVRPHEKTHAGPKEDRRRLLLATGCNLSPIFVLAPDSRGDLASAMSDATEAEPWSAFEALDAEHVVWIVKGTAALRLAALAGDDSVYIADGHHRYETAVHVRNEVPPQWNLGAQRALAHVVSFQDPGLEILPTHRLIRARQLGRDEVLHAATRLFGRAGQYETPHLTCVFADGSEARMSLRPDADLSGVELPADPTVRSLAVTLADDLFIRVVLAEVLGEPPEYGYTAVESEAKEAVTSGRAALAVLLPPTRLEEVKAVSDAGQVMPPKSTYFAPKVPTGIVMRLFEGED